MKVSDLIALASFFGMLSVLSIGGSNSVVPEMACHAVGERHWLTGDAFSDIFAISQAAPGPSNLIVAMIGYTQFEEAFATARVSRPNLARCYLRAMEKTLKEDPYPEYVANEDVRAVNLEHVLPLNPDDSWDAEQETAEAAQKLLGNMVPLRSAQNKDIGDSSFEKKRQVLVESEYYITKKVADYDRWGIEEIKEHQAELGSIARRTWTLDLEQ